MLIDEQVHGYKFGHELLAFSRRLERDDQDVIDRLSDLAGPVAPGEKFAPYLTTYPLPSGVAYVVARTWQDLSAPRAGCVLTRSLIIPMALWASGSSLGEAIAILESKPNSGSDSNLSPHSTTDAPLDLPLGIGSAYAELAEALFLEQRRPTVVFELPDAEVAALRVLKAVWPGLRRVFSVCTRACSPRYLGERPFDLLFAPASSRTNFGRWQDRRVDGTASSYQARHRWTPEIARRVFGTPFPHTLESDAQTLFNVESSDESAFRLSLLWNELIERSVSSPFAVLGLLDIVGVLDKSHAVHELPIIEAALERSLTLAAETYSASEFFDFIIAFLGKFPKKLPAKNLLRRIRQLVSIAGANRTASVEFLQRSELKQTELPVIVAAGLGDGLASHVEEHRLNFFELDTGMMVALICYSRAFSKALVHNIEGRGAKDEIEALASALNIQDEDLSSRARRHLIPNLSESNSFPILQALLDGAPPTALLQATRALWRSNKLAVPEFDLVLLRNVAATEAKPSMRSLLLGLPPSQNVDRMIVGSLSFSELDLEWIQEVHQSGERKSQWILQLVAKQSDGDLKRIPAGVASIALDLMGAADPSNMEVQAARIVIHASPRLESVLRIARSIAVRVDRATAQAVAVTTLSRLLKEPSVVPSSLAIELINDLAPLVQARDLVIWLTPTSGPVERISENLQLLAHSSWEVRGLVQSRIDVLTERVASRRGAIVHQDAIDVWASLIRTAGKFNPDSQLRAAADAWKFAVEHRTAKVSGLVVASFPLLYAQVARDQETPPALGFFSFFDWDRCQTLRSELVDAYMRSSWPPHELFIVADQVGQLIEVANLLLKRLHGHEYFESILLQGDALPVEVFHKVQLIDANRSGHFGA